MKTHAPMQTKLDSFFSAYVTTALWSSTDDEGAPLDSNYSQSDLSHEALSRMSADCEAFKEKASETIFAAVITGDVKCGPDFNEYDRAAHDFWLTRNRHGAGFWDGDWPEPMAAQLTEIAHSFGESNLYVGDDGLLYLL